MLRVNRKLLLPASCGRESVSLSISGRLTAAFTCQSVLWAVLRSRQSPPKGDMGT